MMYSLKNIDGFTLIEMALVLLIITLLLGGMLVPLSTQVEQRQITETQKALEEIQEAIIGFATSKGRLPCPASPTIAAGITGAGQEDCTRINDAGVVPWVSLGVRETDAWGRRFSYRVNREFYDSGDGTGCGTATVGVSFELCSVGRLTVRVSSGGAAAAFKLPVLIISHGRNGFGGYTPQGTPLATSGASADELQNADGNANLEYVRRPYASTFDDIVAWPIPGILMSRMIAANRLP